MTQSVSTDNSYVTSRAQLLKKRWEKKLGQQLEVQTERLMPGPNGQNYRADVVLQNPPDGLPLVVFEVKSPAKSIEEAEANLKRILDTRRFIKLIGGQEPVVVLLVSAGDEAEGGRLQRKLDGKVQLEII